jgi:L-2-hydroxyglutarate oxidase LhgO
VSGLGRQGSSWQVETVSQDGERFGIGAPWVVNAGGLEADSIAELAGLELDPLGYRQHPCKGDYFALAPAVGPITRGLVYPVPSPGGLGVHITMDLGGRYRLGPDVEWVESPRYDVDPAKAESFAEAARRYLPEVRAEQLSPDFAGVRPKLQAPGEPPRDFVIEEASPHGAPGLVNLLGIESPGLTSALAIARRVVELIS